MDNYKIQLYEDNKIRTAWDEEQEEWFFSIVDVVAVLTDSADPQAYWRKLKQRLKAEGNETVTNCHGFKGLKKQNLRDNMSTTELVLNMLAETSTTDISKEEKPTTFEENQKVARRGGRVAGIARQALEAETGKPVITSKNAVDFAKLIDDVAKKVK